jgi:membrane fusion protein, multidrug efflux system
MKSIIGILFAAILGLAQSGCTKKDAAAGNQAMPPVQVVAIEAKRQTVSEALSLVGSIAASETVEIKAETEGIVQEILFDEGQRVTRGQLLVRLDESKLKSSLDEIKANFELSKSKFERSKQLLQDKLLSLQEYEELASTFSAMEAGLGLKERQLRDARIYAPFSGIVGARQVSPGQVITRNSVLTWLVDLDTVKAEVKVPEKYLRQVQAGQALEFGVAAFPGEKFRGELYFISPQIDESTRTVLVKARIPNPNIKLRGGMFASLDLTVQVRESAIVIPESALMSNGDNFSVFVVDDKNVVQMRPVEVGYRLPGKAEVLKGLNAGEKVIVEGVQKVFPGAKVTNAPPSAAVPYTQS